MTVTELKKYYDRCGKECENVRSNRGFRIYRKYIFRRSNNSPIDLCQNCYDSLAAWMKSSETENEEEV